MNEKCLKCGNFLKSPDIDAENKATKCSSCGTTFSFKGKESNSFFSDNYKKTEDDSGIVLTKLWPEVSLFVRSLFIISGIIVCISLSIIFFLFAKPEYSLFVIEDAGERFLLLSVFAFIILTTLIDIYVLLSLKSKITINQDFISNEFYLKPFAFMRKKIASSSITQLYCVNVTTHGKVFYQLYANLKNEAKFYITYSKQLKHVRDLELLIENYLGIPDERVEGECLVELSK